MKKLGSFLFCIGLGCAILFSTTISSFIFFTYQINKAEITKQFCINKDEPIMQCQGKCHLKTQLDKAESNNDPEDTNLPSVKEADFNVWLQIQKRLFFDHIEVKLINFLTCEKTRSGFHQIITPPPQLV